MVEYNTDIYILKPINLAERQSPPVVRGQQSRQHAVLTQQMNEARVDDNDPTKAADAGNGFLMRQGYTILRGRLGHFGAEPGEGRFTIRVPVANNPDGSPIVGPSMEEFVVDNATTTRGRLTYPAATLDKSQGDA